MGLYLESIGRIIGHLSAMPGSRCPPLDPSSATLSAKNTIVGFIESLDFAKLQPAPQFAVAA